MEEHIWVFGFFGGLPFGISGTDRVQMDATGRRLRGSHGSARSGGQSDGRRGPRPSHSMGCHGNECRGGKMAKWVKK